MEEIWKDIKGYEGLYKVSNLGHIYSNYVNRNLEGSLDKYGYKVTILTNNGIHRRYLSHRLVAQAFIPNPENKPQVNHIDEDKINNRIDNLEWNTAKENMNHGTRTERQIATQRIIQKSRSVQCSNGNIYRSTREASRELGVDNSSLNKVLKGKRKQAGGYTFKYAEESYGGDYHS